MALTTHILEVAERLADRIGIIAAGKLVAEGTPEELLDPDLLLCAPRTPATLRREKWLAAVLPTLALGGLVLLVLALRGGLHSAFLGGALLLPLLLMGAGGTALMVLWQPLPIRRADAFRRGQQAVPFDHRAEPRVSIRPERRRLRRQHRKMVGPYSADLWNDRPAERFQHQEKRFAMKG